MAFLAVYVLLAVGPRVVALKACGSNFNAQDALKRTGHVKDVVLPRQNDWTDKYITKKGTRDMLFCDGSVDEFHTGIWGLDSAMATQLRRLGEGAEASGCCIQNFPDNTYAYCDATNTGVAACDGPLVNASYFDSRGEFGQDCTSWQMLTSYLEFGGEIQMFAGDCKRIDAREKAKLNVGEPATSIEASICKADAALFPIIDGYTQAFAGHYEYAQIASELKGFNDPGIGYAACVAECNDQPTCVGFSVKTSGTCFFLVSRVPTNEFHGFDFTASDRNYCSYTKDLHV